MIQRFDIVVGQPCNTSAAKNLNLWHVLDTAIETQNVAEWTFGLTL